MRRKLIAAEGVVIRRQSSRFAAIFENPSAQREKIASNSKAWRETTNEFKLDLMGDLRKGSKQVRGTHDGIERLKPIRKKRCLNSLADSPTHAAIPFLSDVIGSADHAKEKYIRRSDPVKFF